MTTDTETTATGTPLSYRQLDPDTIIMAVESAGYTCDGHVFALNSYENRVYQVGIGEAQPLVAKFYRPARWQDEAILEEHAFCRQLSELEIPVLTPLVDANGETLHSFRQFRFALYPRCGGRPPEPEDPEQLQQIGRFIGRIHALGRSSLFRYRPTLDQEMAIEASRFLLENDFLPAELAHAYQTLSADILQRIGQCFARAGDYARIRLHGDCHQGNILWRDGTPLILDFDDARNGPAMQDLWMFLSGDREQMTALLNEVLTGYVEFSDFDARELHLVEALRTIRIMAHAAWIARRWDDPAFPLAFPFFNSQRYWEDHILSLREQVALMDEAPLPWYP